MLNNTVTEPTSEAGSYNIYDAAGKFVGWNRYYKDAIYRAEQIGGKAIKVKASLKGAPWTNHAIRMQDGSFQPMTKANIKLAQGR